MSPRCFLAVFDAVFDFLPADCRVVGDLVGSFGRQTDVHPVAKTEIHRSTKDDIFVRPRVSFDGKRAAEKFAADL